MTDLNTLVVTAPDARWFYFVETAGDLELVDEKPPDEKLVLAYHLKWLNKRRIRELMTGGVSRKALSRKGLKAFVNKDDEFHANLLSDALLGWILTPRGIQLLEGEFDVSKLEPGEQVEFNAKNVKAMAQHSLMGTDVYGLLTEHDEWFSADEDTEGNSPSGPDGSSVEPPAGSASEST
jgi:hypothetical protein